jgi:hypothetical protein
VWREGITHRADQKDDYQQQYQRREYQLPPCDGHKSRLLGGIVAMSAMVVMPTVTVVIVVVVVDFRSYRSGFANIAFGGMRLVVLFG